MASVRAPLLLRPTVRAPHAGARSAAPTTTPLPRVVPARAVATGTIRRDGGDDALDAGVTDVRSIPPATLPGTPPSVPFTAAQLIDKAQALFETDTGVRGGPGAEALLADDFRFEFPVVSLAKAEYLKAVRSFNLRTAIPNLNANAYGWQVDAYEPNRVWFFIRTSGTATGELNFFGKVIKPSSPPKTITGAPEICSYTFNADGKCTSFTGGYVADRRVGNTGGSGAVFGILYALGAPVPKPGTLGFAVASLLRKVTTAIAGLVAAVTGKKEATA